MNVATAKLGTAILAVVSNMTAPHTLHRPHDDIAALKRLLREVFTKQIQMDTRISALEPQQESAPSFDALVRSNNGWITQSSAGKAKVELSGELTTGSGLLYSQASFCVYWFGCHTMMMLTDSFLCLKP